MGLLGIFGDTKLLQEKDNRLLDKDLLIQQMDLRIHEKDEFLQQMKVAFLVIMLFTFFFGYLFAKEKERLVAEKERALTKSEAEHIHARSQFQAEWNLRPVLETKVMEFLTQKHLAVPPGGQEKLNAYRVWGLPNRQHFLDHLQQAMMRNSIAPTEMNSVNKEIDSLYSTLSKKHHNGDAPDGVVGYVVNHDKYFATAVSAFLMSLELKHTVMKTGCQEVLYKWEVPAHTNFAI